LASGLAVVLPCWTFSVVFFDRGSALFIVSLAPVGFLASFSECFPVGFVVIASLPSALARDRQRPQAGGVNRAPKRPA
jgi:hypothetical protein